MVWNWQRKDWPKFEYDEKLLKPLEEKFLYQSGILVGMGKCLNDEQRHRLTVAIISDEAVKTSEIAGEDLNRDSVQFSIREHFGLTTDKHAIDSSGKGISDLLYNLYVTFAEPLTHNRLFAWHTFLNQGRVDVKEIGRYRTHKEAMQIISEPTHELKIHFEAPPSKQVLKEMESFIHWFNQTGPHGSTPLPALIRSGIAHHYFVCIHPFEGGNGRLARALAEKSLSQSIGQAALIAPSHLIQKHKNRYYDALARNNKGNEITDWLYYFATTILEAQSYTQSLIHFMTHKIKFYNKIKNKLNPRQEKVIDSMFQEGLEGFKEGLSAEKYIYLTCVSRATATRDLQGLVDMGALIKTSGLKFMRYHLNIERL